MNIKTVPTNNITKVEKEAIQVLINTIWSNNNTPYIHPKEMNATSFYIADKNKIIAYLGVLSWGISIKTETFKMGGLSCVCTHPKYRKQGIGTELVRNATEWIIQKGEFDLGLFTCSQENTSFYEHIGLWERCHNLIIKESNREGAYISNQMEVNVFRLLISEKAKQYTDYFENSIINLNFPSGEFI